MRIRNFLRILSCAVICAISAQPARAAENEDLLTGYSVTTWNDGDGRPFGAVNAIVQDRRGYLWIGADAGLFRFDGSRFTAWEDISDKPLPKTAVTALCFSRDGTMWVGFADDSPVRRIRDGQVDVLPRTNAPALVNDLVEDAGGALWAVGDGVLFKWDGVSWRKTILTAAGREARVRQIYRRSNGQLLAGTWIGVFEQNARTGIFDRLATHVAWGVTEDANGTIWTTDIADGFRRIDGQASAKQSGAGYRVMFDRGGDLWVATFGAGLWHVTNVGGKHVVYRAGLRTGLSSDLVQAVFEDRDGNIWAGTSGGLHRLTRRKLTPIEDLGYAIAVTPSTSSTPSAGSGMWVGRTTGVVRFTRDGERWSPAQLVSERPDVRSLYDDHRGTLWVGATDGLFRFANGTLMPVPLPVRSRLIVTSIAPAPNGALWLSDGAWLFRWDGTRLVTFDQVRDASVFGRILYVQLDRSLRLWLGFESGRLGFLDAVGRLHMLGVEHGFDIRAHDQTHTVFEDDNGTVWVGSSGGLGRFANNHFAMINRKNGLPGDQVWSILVDARERLWLSVDRGLVSLDRHEFENAVADSSYHVQYRLYDTLDGLAGGAFGRVSSARAADGSLWFVQGGGLTRLNPDSIRDHPAAVLAPVYIESALTANERVPGPAQHRSFPHGTGRLQINYTAVALSAPNKLRFRYRLLGVDADWVNVGTQRAAFYTNLAPGNYQFEVEASAEEGIWNTSKALWTFSILPAFYQTVWFYAACATATLLGFWGLWRLRLRLVKREFSLVLAERARLSRELHDTLLQSLVGVVLQLEPIAQTVASEPVLARNQIIRVRRQVEAYVREARESIKKLRSPSLSTRNLAAALQEFGQEAVAHREIRFALTVTGSAYPLAPDVEGELFRVGQEAITNAVRHADATRIDAALTFTATHVTLRVEDDGCGFDYDARDMDVNHYGLITMKERAEELHGGLTIASRPGRGTTIQAIVPARPESRRAIPA